MAELAAEARQCHHRVSSAYSPRGGWVGWFRHTEAAGNRSLNHGNHSTARRTRSLPRLDAAPLIAPRRKRLDVIMAVNALVVGGCPQGRRHRQLGREAQDALPMAGELVQVDHMAVSHDVQTFREFRAVAPASRVMMCRVFSNANARNAKRLLAKKATRSPWLPQPNGAPRYDAGLANGCLNAVP